MNSPLISEERQTHLAHLITDSIWEDDLADYTDDDLALKLAKKAIQDFVQEDEALCERARQKVASLKRGVLEGSPEWDVLFKKYSEEERQKLKTKTSR